LMWQAEQNAPGSARTGCSREIKDLSNYLLFRPVVARPCHMLGTRIVR
jgi:hypothetical protein